MEREGQRGEENGGEEMVVLVGVPLLLFSIQIPPWVVGTVLPMLRAGLPPYFDASHTTNHFWIDFFGDTLKCA